MFGDYIVFRGSGEGSLVHRHQKDNNKQNRSIYGKENLSFYGRDYHLTHNSNMFPLD